MSGTHPQPLPRGEPDADGDLGCVPIPLLGGARGGSVTIQRFTQNLHEHSPLICYQTNTALPMITNLSAPPNQFVPKSSTTRLQADNLVKSFVLHTQGSIELPALEGVSLAVNAGECVALSGPSGSGKSTFMRSLYANYRIDSGHIWVQHQNNWVDLAQLEPHQLIEVRQHTLGYVSQFLRVIPRVPAVEVAAEPLMELGVDREDACETVRGLFQRLNLPERLA